MTTRTKWVAVVLLVVVGLGLVAFVPRPPEPTVVSGHVTGGLELNRIYRFWSDGVVDVSVRFYPDSAACGTAGGSRARSSPTSVSA